MTAKVETIKSAAAPSPSTPREKIEKAIVAIRAEREAYIDGLLAERQAILDKTSVASDGLVKPGKAQLVLADYQNIEELFNKQLATLREQLRLVDIAEAAASIDGIEAEIEHAEEARDAARVALSEADARLAQLEGRLARTIELANSAKVARNRIQFEPWAKELSNTRGVYDLNHLEQIRQRILNY